MIGTESTPLLTALELLQLENRARPYSPTTIDFYKNREYCQAQVEACNRFYVGCTVIQGVLDNKVLYQGRTACTVTF